MRTSAAVVVLVVALASRVDAATVKLKINDNAATITGPAKGVVATPAIVKADTAGIVVVANVTGEEEDFVASAAIAAAVAAATASNVNGHVDGNTAAAAAAAAGSGDNGDGGGSSSDGDDDDDALSAVWYLAAFGGLVLFFFVVTCSELFLDNPIHARRQLELPHARDLRRHWRQRNSPMAGYFGPETPPPPYHQFAPPSYDDFIKSEKQKQPPHGTKPPAAAAAAADFDKPKIPEVYIVPVHNGGAPVSVATTAARAALDSVAISAAQLQKQLDAVTPRGKCSA